MASARDEGTMGGVHVLAVDVSWGHCDPAGIVYFPRFFEMFHAAMESWFGAAAPAGLGLPYQAVIVGRRLGFPAVHTEADFRLPTQFGERIAIELRVAKLGRSSIELTYAVRGPAGEVRATGRTVCAVMDLDPASPTHRRGCPLPDDLRAAIEAFGIAR